MMIDVGSLEHDVIKEGLYAPTLAENVLQGCVYIVKGDFPGDVIKGTGGDPCSDYEIKNFKGKSFSLIY